MTDPIGGEETFFCQDINENVKTDFEGRKQQGS